MKEAISLGREGHCKAGEETCDDGDKVDQRKRKRSSGDDGEIMGEGKRRRKEEDSAEEEIDDFLGPLFQ